MSNSSSQKIARWLFGSDGTVVLSAEMQVVMVMTAVGVSGIFVMSPIVSQLADPFGISVAQAGQLVTAFVAPSILLVPVMGILADRIGRKPVIVSGLIVFGVAGTAVGLTSSFVAALGLRAIQGIGYAAVIPIGTALIGDLYESSRETTAQGLRVASIQTTNLVSPPLAGVLVIISWRVPFFLYAIALAVAVVAWRKLPASDPVVHISFNQYVRNLLALVSDPVLAGVIVSFAVRFLLTFGFFAYVSVLLSQTVEASTFVIGIVVSMFALVSLTSAAQAGRLAESWNIFLVTLIGICLSGIGMIIMGAIPIYPAIIVGVILAGIGAGVTGPTQKSLVTQLAPASLRAGAVSAAVIFQSIGSTAGPLLMGLSLTRFSVTSTFVIFGITGTVVGSSAIAMAYLQTSPGTATGQ